jgi:hypothetical protein
LLFAGGAVLAATAVVLHALDWRRQASVDWPAFFNMLGLLVLTGTGAFDPPPGRLRVALSAIALSLILPSAFLILRR